MRVLFLAHAYPRFAGDPVGSFIANLAVALRDEGVEVVVSAPSAPGVASHDMMDGIRVERFRYAPRAMETLAYTGTMGAQVKESLRGKLAMGSYLVASLRAANALARRERIVDPYARRFDVLILAHGAIHPGERLLVDADGRLAFRIPERDDVGDAETEAIAIGEAVGGIVGEALGAHAARCRRGAHAEIVLPNANGIDARDGAQLLALLDEERVLLRRAEASVEADLMASLADGVQDPARRLAVGAIREIAGASGGDRRSTGEDEPR